MPVPPTHTLQPVDGNSAPKPQLQAAKKMLPKFRPTVSELTLATTVLLQANCVACTILTVLRVYTNV